MRKISLIIISALLFSNLFFIASYLKVDRLYEWHYLRYHELQNLISYKEKYPIGTLKSKIIRTEPNYIRDHAWCINDPNRLCVEPKIGNWEYEHYCGFTFYFKSDKLIEIKSNSPCH